MLWKGFYVFGFDFEAEFFAFQFHQIADQIIINGRVSLRRQPAQGRHI